MLSQPIDCGFCTSGHKSVLFPLPPMRISKILGQLRSNRSVFSVSFIVSISVNFDGFVQNPRVSFMAANKPHEIKPPFESHGGFVEVEYIGNHCRGKPFVPQNFGQQNIRRLQSLPPSERKCKSSGKIGGPAGDGGNSLRIVVIKYRTFCSQCIDIRCFDPIVSIAAQMIQSQAVIDNENYIHQISSSVSVIDSPYANKGLWG